MLPAYDKNQEFILRSILLFADTYLLACCCFILKAAMVDR